MAQWHGISRRKKTGGRNVQARGKRSTEISSEKQYALVGESKRKIYRKTGGNSMTRVLRENVIAVADPAKGTVTKADILTVVDNPCNPNYVRRNILTKGAVVETSMGNVRVTSRPGKDGVLNGVLL